MKKRSREAAAPDITPMIDVVFLLLIFFMVSTVFKKDEMALLLNLPKTEKGESAQREQKTIYIELSKTEIAYNGTKTTLESLEDTLKGVTKKTMPIDLRIDKDVKYDRVVLLIGKLKKYELTNVSLITDE
ncbi:biopolymer transporter ExbD [Halobacteriovorax sp. JY17]|uniref:ExbD/TolR family protein n=1 Tax=Halobacteriovorax sp. JY17 TaxID=2014617 RepID=UPI000C63982B|nr:biopolymer transporter ExbD [Halobacteriovorax sp. JY17]PIK16304.1 MAG: biopolymer transporter ExbD [Halobacteriovorax sp. JY17]